MHPRTIRARTSAAIAHKAERLWQRYEDGELTEEEYNTQVRHVVMNEALREESL